MSIEFGSPEAAAVVEKDRELNLRGISIEKRIRQIDDEIDALTTEIEIAEDTLQSLRSELRKLEQDRYVSV